MLPKPERKPCPANAHSRTAILYHDFAFLAILGLFGAMIVTKSNTEVSCYPNTYDISRDKSASNDLFICSLFATFNKPNASLFVVTRGMHTYVKRPAQTSQLLGPRGLQRSFVRPISAPGAKDSQLFLVLRLLNVGWCELCTASR